MLTILSMNHWITKIVRRRGKFYPNNKKKYNEYDLDGWLNFQVVTLSHLSFN